MTRYGYRSRGICPSSEHPYGNKAGKDRSFVEAGATAVISSMAELGQRTPENAIQPQGRGRIVPRLRPFHSGDRRDTTGNRYKT